jgi:hypothetical protein
MFTNLYLLLAWSLGMKILEVVLFNTNLENVLLEIEIWKHLSNLGTASVVYWSEFLATDPEVSGSIPGATRFYEK